MKFPVARYPTLTLKVSLLDMPETVYRTVMVRSYTSLRELHHIIQAVMPWNSSHLYEFTRNVKGREVRYLDTDLWVEDEEDTIKDDDRLYFVGDLFKKVGDRLDYVYDIGDYWQHVIELEDIDDDPLMLPMLPAVIEGHGVCPPDDCGGTHGYRQMREVIADRRHPEYKSTMVWLKSFGWKDGAFELAKAEFELATMRLRLVEYYSP